MAGAFSSSFARTRAPTNFIIVSNKRALAFLARRFLVTFRVEPPPSRGVAVSSHVPPVCQRLDSWIVARTVPEPSYSYISVAKMPPMTAVPSVTRADEEDTSCTR